MSDLETQARANLGGGNTSSPPPSGSDLEAQAQIRGNSSTQDEYQQQLRDHAEKVADLRQRVEEADSDAEQAENQAQEAKASAEQAANSGGGVFGTLAIALNGGVQFKAEQDAQKKCAEADRLRAQLNELGEEVIQPPPLRNSIEEDAGRDRIPALDVEECRTFQQMQSDVCKETHQIARELDVGRGVLSDLFNGCMRPPIRQRLVDGLLSSLHVSIEAFGNALDYALSNPRLGHAKADQTPVVLSRSCDEIIRDSNMSPERKRFWLEED